MYLHKLLGINRVPNCDCGQMDQNLDPLSFFTVSENFCLQLQLGIKLSTEGE